MKSPFSATIDLIQKLTNQQGQKGHLFFHFRFSVILSVLLHLSKGELAFAYKLTLFHCCSSNAENIITLNRK
jgi:hypothetical protein